MEAEFDLGKIVSNYIQVRGLSEVKVNIEIIIAEDFYDSYYNLSTEKQREEVIKKKDWINSLNGSVVFPECIDGKCTILLSKPYILECFENTNLNFVGTICHELTHIYDHLGYMKIVGITDFEALPAHPTYNMFNNWTEFNARKTGYLFLRNFYIKDPYEQEIIDHVTKTELPYQTNYYFEKYHSTTDGDLQIYITMQYLGRLKAWKDVYPDIFTSDFIFELLKTNKWMIDLFRFLDENDVLERAFGKFSKMKDILKTNFTFAEA